MGDSVGGFRGTPGFIGRMRVLLLLVAICFTSAAISWGRVAVTLPPEQSFRSTWIAISCVFTACVTSVAVKSRLVHQRRIILEEQMAASLAVALRRGDLDFNIPVSGSTVNIFAFWRDLDALEESEVQLIPSRYRLLGHTIRLLPGPTPAPEERPTVRVRLIGSAESRNRDDRQDDLMLGVPRLLLTARVPDELPEAAG